MKTMLKIYAFIAMVALISSQASGQKADIIKLTELKSIISPDSDTTYVINFWATWCKPCVKELPHFEKLSEEMKDKKVKVILMSLDFKRQYETTLMPFLNKNKITADVHLIDEPDYNLWIDLVDPSWSGAIPATLVINSSTNQRDFYEKEFTYSELKSIVEPIITP